MEVVKVLIAFALIAAFLNGDVAGDPAETHEAR
jgi:hypothetical protein